MKKTEDLLFPKIALETYYFIDRFRDLLFPKIALETYLLFPKIALEIKVPVTRTIMTIIIA